MGLVSLGACVAGFVLDFIFGDPVWLYHPVRLIGKWISFLEKLLRRKTGEKRQIAAGGILWILTVAGETDDIGVVSVFRRHKFGSELYMPLEVGKALDLKRFAVFLFLSS